MSFAYTEVERLILERWTDVTGLMAAHRALQDRVEEMIEVVGDRLARWARPHGYELETFAKEGEYQLWRPAWTDRKKEPRVVLTLGGFCPIGYRKAHEPHPFLWLYTNQLEYSKVKEPQRIAFAQSLRTALGEAAGEWEAPSVDDANSPLGRYLTQYDDNHRARLLREPDALFGFCTEHLPTLFGLGDIIEAELNNLFRARS